MIRSEKSALDFLDARDSRQDALTQVLSRGYPAVLFVSLNIPGYEKTPPGSEALFLWVSGELEKVFATFDLPVLTYLRDTQVYVQATAAGMTIFDLPPSRAERDLEQWRAIIEWAEAGD